MMKFLDRLGAVRRTAVRLTTGLAAATGLYLFALAAISVQSTAHGAPATSDGVWVVGNHLVRNGEPFLVKGVIFVGHVAPADLLGANQREYSSHFGAPILNAAKAWNVNTIRYNLSQPALDPQSPLYNEAGYIAEIQSAVQLARGLGFIVIVTDQDEDDSHDPNPPPVRMPTAATLRADLTLTRLFKTDRGVMIELFNEPHMDPTPANWQLWLNGGNYRTNGNATEAMVGFQTLVNDLRAAGSHNVLLVDAITTHSFAGVPTTLTDPLHDFVYDPHLLNPTNRQRGTVADWQSSFGFLADEGRPVILGAFNAATSAPPGSRTPSSWCKNDPSLERPQALLAFLSRKRIGVVGWAFDHPGTIVADYNGVPTTYRGKRCGDPDGGSGELLRAQFALPAPKY